MSNTTTNTNNTIKEVNGMYLFNDKMYPTHAQAVVAYAKAAQGEVVNFKKDILTNGFGEGSMGSILSFQVNGETGKKSITHMTGAVTNADATLQLAVRSGKYDNARKMISGMVQSKGTTNGGEYKSPIFHELNKFYGYREYSVVKSVLDKVKAAIIACDLSINKNIVAIANDLNKVARCYQETVIDASKTGEYLELDLMVKGFKDLSLCDWEGGIAFNRENSVNQYGDDAVVTSKDIVLRRLPNKNRKTVLTESVVSKIQDACAKRYVDELSSLYSLETVLPQSLIDGAKEAVKSDKFWIFKNVQTMYFILMEMYSAAKNNEKDDNSDESHANLVFKQGIDMLKQYVRTATKGMDLEEVISLAYASVMYKNSNSRPNLNASNKFVLNVLEEEFEIYINGGDNVVMTAYQLQNKGLKDGDCTFFFNGKCYKTNSVILNSKALFSGVAKIKIDEDGKCSAVVPTVIERKMNDDVILFVTSHHASAIKVGDRIEVGTKQVTDITGKSTSVEVTSNDTVVGELFYNRKAERSLEGIGGNVLEVINTVKHYEDGSVFRAMVRINKDVTRQDLIEAVTTKEEPSEYFDNVEVNFDDINFNFENKDVQILVDADTEESQNSNGIEVDIDLDNEDEDYLEESLEDMDFDM